MKSLFFILLAFFLMIPSCKKQESGITVANKPFTFSEVKGAVVYDQNNNETTITGNVVGRDQSIIIPFMDLGTITAGRLDLVFPDFPLGQENRFFSEISTDGINNIRISLPEIEISPQDATWLLLDDSKFLLVFTDEDAPSVFNPRETTKQNYILRFYDQAEEFEVCFAFFAKDTTVKGGGTFFGYTIEIDINASRGWNIIHVKNSESSSIVKTARTSISEIKWVASKTITSYRYNDFF